jgi:hypothetical protein
MQDPQIWGVRNIKHQLGFSSRIGAEETTSTFDDVGFALELQHRK